MAVKDKPKIGATYKHKDGGEYVVVAVTQYSLVNSISTHIVEYKKKDSDIINYRRLEQFNDNFKRVNNISLDKIICTCREVTIGEILFVIKEKTANTVEDISRLCDAGVCCKSCIRKENEIRLNIQNPIYLEDILIRTKKI